MGEWYEPWVPSAEELAEEQALWAAVHEQFHEAAETLRKLSRPGRTRKLVSSSKRAR